MTYDVLKYSYDKITEANAPVLKTQPKISESGKGRLYYTGNFSRKTIEQGVTDTGFRYIQPDKKCKKTGPKIDN